LKILALHGLSRDAWKRYSDDGYKHYDVVECGFKYNMMDLQAAIGIHQLKRVETNWVRRRGIWNRYNTALAGLPVELPCASSSGSRHAHHLYTIRIHQSRCGITRDAFLQRMTHAGIGVGVHYRSIPELSYYRDRYGWDADQFPHARDIGRTTVSLPLSAKLGDRDVDRVIRTVTSLLS
jgi:dTDP-4-amino-4,6-dideoxygalactose transaminase